MTTFASSYDLRAFAGSVLDQGNSGACVPCSTVSVIDTIMREAGHPVDPLSALAFYGDVRTYQNDFKYDHGSTGPAMEYVSMNTGFAYESAWPYDLSNLYVHTPASIASTEYSNHVTSWIYTPSTQTLNGMINTVRTFLDQGKSPILFFTPQSYFFEELGPLNTLNGGGPHDSEAKHAVQIIAMDDNLNGGSYIVKNSWGTGWGDGGYGIINYKQFAPNFNNVEIQGFYTISGFSHDGVNYDFTYSAERTTVDTAYACVLGRAAETGGLDWWAGQVKTGATQYQIIDAFLNSSEGQLIYGNDTDAQFVNAVYHNVLNRDVDAGGLAYWTAALQTGLTHGQLFSGIIDSVSKSKTDLAAHDFLLNKIDLAMYESVAMQYDGVHHSDAMISSLSHVTNDANAVEIVKIGLQHSVLGY